MRGDENNRPLRRVGALWKPRAGATSLGSGRITIAGQRQRFVVLRNAQKSKATDPDFVLMSSDNPEPDPYAERPSATQGRSRVPATVDAPLTDDDIPF
jgi:hypothetical protein